MSDIHLSACVKGEFWMGYDERQSHHKDLICFDAYPRHLVRIQRDFLISTTTITQNVWQCVMGWQDANYQGDLQNPIVCISWYDCLWFCHQLSLLEGLKPCFSFSKIEKEGHHIKQAIVEWIRNANGYRLPTEAEWEYCAKAGTEMKFSGSNEIDEVAWYHVNAGDQRLDPNLWQQVKYDGERWINRLRRNHNQPHAVAMKTPNPWGLYDMTGNVWEWCMDEWDDETYQNRATLTTNDPVVWVGGAGKKVMRGGSCQNTAENCQNSFRNCLNAQSINPIVGFRIVRNQSSYA